MIDTAYRIENLYSDMSTEEIRSAFEDISIAVSILKDAIDNRLEALGGLRPSFSCGHVKATPCAR